MPRNGNETAPEWLERVAKTSQDPEVRKLAIFTQNQWKGLRASWKTRDVDTRRSLYDLMSGILQVARRMHHFKMMTPVVSGDEVFYFPIFREACDYRGKDAPADAIITGIQVRSHRRPQKTKWGNDILKT